MCWLNGYRHITTQYLLNILFVMDENSSAHAFKSSGLKRAKQITFIYCKIYHLNQTEEA